MTTTYPHPERQGRREPHGPWRGGPADQEVGRHGSVEGEFEQDELVEGARGPRGGVPPPELVVAADEHGEGAQREPVARGPRENAVHGDLRPRVTDRLRRPAGPAARTAPVGIPDADSSNAGGAKVRAKPGSPGGGCLVFSPWSSSTPLRRAPPRPPPHRWPVSEPSPPPSRWRGPGSPRCGRTRPRPSVQPRVPCPSSGGCSAPSTPCTASTTSACTSGWPWPGSPPWRCACPAPWPSGSPPPPSSCWSDASVGASGSRSRAAWCAPPCRA